ncbi:outer membrane protein assembly factor BamE [Solimonas sp. SE-A11]|uniref:OmpA family protein n=1 Tax=Solimonas sp. SE-A11 TaxID=3054954 RepID=UPI00259D204B|nr:outer membrane protein assembly factor BamE [Solimonas sp. SE-A11]MDM4772155.1 outer membrane protein assembly factor BamE [Solimonas sp. SE-A11]
MSLENDNSSGKAHQRCRKTGGLLAALVTAMALAGCSTPRLAPDAHGVSFPPREASYRSDGIVVAADTVRLLQPGVSKDQVRQLVGNPHFSEGLFEVREWNYILKLPSGEGALLECQLQLRFDERSHLRSRHWQTEACSAAEGGTMLAGGKPSTVSADGGAAGEAAEGDARGDRWTEDDLVFPFGRSSLDDLRAADRARLKALVTRVVRQLDSVDRVVVIGHADRVGSDSRKQSRALDRAHAVAEAFTAKGVAPGIIEVMGRSDTEPLSACPSQPPLAELLACLTADRRVSVIVHMKKG